MCARRCHSCPRWPCAPSLLLTQRLGDPHRAWVLPGAHSEEVKAWPGRKMLELGACGLTDLLVLRLLGCSVGRWCWIAGRGLRGVGG